MSRLDIITIAIVGLCLIALIYLLTKVAQINEPQNAKTVENTKVSIDTVPQDTLLNEESKTDTNMDSIHNTIEEKKMITPTEKKSSETNPAGRFLVVAASFNTLELAEQEQKRLAKLGYNNSEIGYFNQRKIVSVIIGRYNDYNTAEGMAKQMKSNHQIDAYVHRKRN